MKKSKILALAVLVLGTIYLLISLSLVIDKTLIRKNNTIESETSNQQSSTSPDIDGPSNCKHEFSAEWISENGQHFHKCTLADCNYTDTKISCSGGNATCTQKAICQFCSSPYGDIAEHIWNTSWDYSNDAGHAHNCLYGCNTHSEIQPHVPGPEATETSPQVCVECDFVIIPSKNHMHTIEKISFKNASCTEYGNIEHFVCTECSKLFYDSLATQEILDSNSVKSAPLGHDFSDASCTDARRCQHEGCNATDGLPLGHTPKDDLYSNADIHWHECSVCSVPIDQAPHAPGPEATENSPQYCLDCRYIIVPTKNHVHSIIEIAAKDPTCTTSGNIAYFKCSGCSKCFLDISATKEIAGSSSINIAQLGHDYSAATCTTPKTCKRSGCGNTVGQALGHTPSNNWSLDSQYHWHQCSACGDRVDKSAHTPGASATEQSPQTCTQCGYVIAQKLEHTHKYGTSPKYDLDNHWYECSCGHIGNKQAHADSNKDSKCDTCKYNLPPVTSEGENLEDILGPAQITLLRPVASGVLTKSNSSAIIDYSNYADGYVMVKYIVDTTVRLKVQVQGPSTTYTYNISPHEWNVFPLSDDNGAYTIKVFKNASGNRYSVALSLKFDAKLSDEFAPFLRPNQYVNYENAVNSMNKAAEIVAGKSDTLDKVAAIYNYIIRNISYDYEKAETIQSGYLPDLDQVLAEKKGICFDYAALMAGMLRSQNIACKLVVGYADTAYHAWISVWTPNKGWIDGAIFFDGVKWQLMDPTYASALGSSIINKVNYTSKYIY